MSANLSLKIDQSATFSSTVELVDVALVAHEHNSLIIMGIT
jgi:hypothetical protein